MDLTALGFGPFFRERFAPLEGLVPARVAAEHRGGVEVWAEAGAGLARLSGKRRHAGEVAAVGDWVALREPPSAERTVVIEHVLERRTVFTRAAAGRETRAQIVAANVDQVFVVCGLDADFNVRRVERYLARVWASGASPAVILNKADLAEDLVGATREIERHAPGVPVFVTRALEAEGLPSIAATIGPGSTAAFVGSSGAGKSTLINALVGADTMATGAIREADGRGRHTTTHRQLVVLPQGGLLLDTPGMRELALLDDEGLDRAFGDVDALASACRFADCTHEHEPGCAVREAARTGAIDADRVDHYLALQREARAHEARHDAQKRKQSARLWGQLHAEAARLRRWKEGG